MEEVDIEERIDEIKIQPVTYSATYDPLSGEVTAVGPSIAFVNSANVLSLEKEIAEMIIEGKINIANCAVDVRDLTFTLIEKKTVVKIDDIVHRIIDKRWSEIENPDIVISICLDKNTLTFELTEEFYGTYKLPEKYQPVTKRKIIWDGETILNFYITEYNDPNVLYQTYSVILKDLIDKKITYNDVKFPNNFSVYTRRVLKNYIIEYI